MKELIARGAMNEALAVLAASLGARKPGKIDFDTAFDPRHDLVWDGAAQAPGPRRAALALIARARRKAPRDPSLSILEGAVRCAFRDFAAARRALDRAPGALWAKAWRFKTAAHEALATKDADLLDEAVRLSREPLREDPGLFLVYAWRAKLYTGFDLHPEALADLDAALRLEPSFAWGLAEIADIRTTRHELEPALLACDRLIALHPGQGWAYTLRGRSWGKCGRAREALLDLDRGIALGPATGAMHSWRGEARRRAGDLAGAFEDFQAAERRDPGYPLTYLWRGAARLKLGRYKEAVADLTRSLRLDPWSLLACAWRGEALLKLGRLEEARKDLDAFFPSHPRETWTGGAEAFWKDLEAAARTEAPAALALRGRFFLDNPAVAPERPLEDLRAAAAARPGDAWCRAWLAEARRRLGQRREALKDLDAAVRLKPSWAWAWAWRGRLRLEAEDLAGARKDLDRSLRLDPVSGEVYAWRARAGGPEERRRDLRRAAALGYREALEPAR